MKKSDGRKLKMERERREGGEMRRILREKKEQETRK